MYLFPRDAEGKLQFDAGAVDAPAVPFAESARRWLKSLHITDPDVLRRYTEAREHG